MYAKCKQMEDYMKQIETYSKNELIVKYIQTLIETKKVVTPKLKKQLIAYGFKEMVIGTKLEHKIQSKDIKFNFHGNDIAIGLSPVAISYGSLRRYFALVYNFNKS